MPKNYKICNRCVMDTSAIDITFSREGYCNFCSDYLDKSSFILSHDNPEKLSIRKLYFDTIKKEGERKQYDCIVGVSGGVDSSWTLKLVKDEGLRPLAVHLDNGESFCPYL